MKNILLIKGQSQYGAMRLYIDEIADAFRKLGFHTMVLDFMEYSFKDQLNEAVKLYHFDILFTCNAQVIGLQKNMGSYFVSYLCDHPVQHRERYLKADKTCFLIQCDEEQKKFALKHYPQVGKIDFVPLSGSYNPQYIPYEERRYDIVFTGSYINPNLYLKNYMEGLTSEMKQFAGYMADMIVAEPELALEQVMERALEKFNVSVDGEEYLDLLSDFDIINSYVRMYYRDKLLHAITDGGFRVDVFGNGWESFETDYSENLVIHKEGAYVAQKAVAEARISLNIMPWFKAGFQERIATAMLSGTVAVTDSSAYIEQNFKDGKNIIIYSLREIEAVVPRIKNLLEDAKEAERIAINGKKLAIKKHTWFHRAQEIADLMEKFCGTGKPEQGQGKSLELSYNSVAGQRDILLDHLNALNECLNLLHELQSFSEINLYDYNHILGMTVKAAERIVKTFPDCFFPVYIWNLLEVSDDRSLQPKTEFLTMVLRSMREQLLSIDYRYAVNKAGQLEMQNREWDAKYHRLVSQRVIANYEGSKDPSILEILSFVKQNNRIDAAYNYRYVTEYLSRDISEYGMVEMDEEHHLPYTFYLGKKMYYPREYSLAGVQSALRFVMMEQDSRSPHLYLDEAFNIEEGDVVIDAGVAEGNFALSVVDKVSRLYLVECEEKWIEALEQTFAPYSDKVVIIQKMLGDYDDETHITVDSLLDGETVNFIKMDIEGAELQALKGAEHALAYNRNLKCAICAYHKKNDEKNIKRILNRYGFEVSTTDGYMFYRFDEDSLIDGELRRGIVRGVKQEN